MRINDLLVMDLARLGGAQIHDFVGLRIHPKDILVSMRLLLAAIMGFLLLRIFQTLTPPNGGINQQVS